jgi:hypothetical protein
MLIRIGQLAGDHAEIAELDINPPIADARRAIAADVRIRIAVPSCPGMTRLSILPIRRNLRARGSCAMADRCGCGRCVPKTNLCGATCSTI